MSCNAKTRGAQPKGAGKPIQTPDCAASKSTTVTTPEGEQLRVTFNMGTGAVTYDETPTSNERCGVPPHAPSRA